VEKPALSERTQIARHITTISPRPGLAGECILSYRFYTAYLVQKVQGARRQG